MKYLNLFFKPALVMMSSIMIFACGGNGGSSNQGTEQSNSISISGAVQKGPFIVGTTVYINRLDARGNASESTVVTEVEDSIGSFSFKLRKSGPVQIVSNGYYFSELTGQISSGTLTLKAIYAASAKNEQKAYVNMLTHLINDRVLNLIKNGDMTLNNAITQAQTELISALSPVIPIDNIPDFNVLSVYNINPANDVGNAYLLALSTAFYKYAEIKAKDQNTSADAQLSLILNQIAVDFADDGIIQYPGFVNDLTTALRELNPKAITDNLAQRSRIDFSDTINIPDITRFFGLCAGAANCMWSTRAPMPFPTRGHASVVYKGKIYVFGGVTPADYANNYDIGPVANAFTGVYQYDTETNQWSQKEPMPIGLYDLSAHTIGDKIYIFGGFGNGGFINSVMQYDPVNNSWAQKTPMPTYRYTFMSEEVGGKVYVIGGNGPIDSAPSVSGNPWVYKNLVEIYDPGTDSWSNGNSAPSNLAAGASCKINGDIYIFGGDAGTISSQTYMYNTVTDSWTAKSSAAVARDGHTCVAIGNNFYLMGGRDSQGKLDTLEVYSTETDTWKEVSYLPTARYWFSANPIGASIYIFGGVGGELNTQISSVEVLDTQMIK